MLRVGVGRAVVFARLPLRKRTPQHATAALPLNAARSSTPLPQHTNPPSQQDTPLLPHPAHTHTHAHLRRDAVLLDQRLLRQVDLQRVVGRQRHAQPAREEGGEGVLVVVEEEGVVGERRHAEADLGVLWW